MKKKFRNLLLSLLFLSMPTCTRTHSGVVSLGSIASGSQQLFFVVLQAAMKHPAIALIATGCVSGTVFGGYKLYHSVYSSALMKAITTMKEDLQTFTANSCNDCANTVIKAIKKHTKILIPEVVEIKSSVKKGFQETNQRLTVVEQNQLKMLAQLALVNTYLATLEKTNATTLEKVEKIEKIVEKVVENQKQEAEISESRHQELRSKVEFLQQAHDKTSIQVEEIWKVTVGESLEFPEIPTTDNLSERWNNLFLAPQKKQKIAVEEQPQLTNLISSVVKQELQMQQHQNTVQNVNSVVSPQASIMPVMQVFEDQVTAVASKFFAQQEERQYALGTDQCGKLIKEMRKLNKHLIERDQQMHALHQLNMNMFQSFCYMAQEFRTCINYQEAAREGFSDYNPLFIPREDSRSFARGLLGFKILDHKQ